MEGEDGLSWRELAESGRTRLRGNGSKPWRRWRDNATNWRTMDFTFLFDRSRDLFSIGCNVSERRRDQSFYDLLASEARLCSYVAIAQGQVPQDHWFSLGRLLVAPRGEPTLVSWSGSMFEYLMPLLVMPNYENTLLDHTCQAAVQRADRIRPGRAECPGAFRNRATTAPTSAFELSIPRFRRSGSGFETRAGRGPGHRALCHVRWR